MRDDDRINALLEELSLVLDTDIADEPDYLVDVKGFDVEALIDELVLMRRKREELMKAIRLAEGREDG